MRNVLRATLASITIMMILFSVAGCTKQAGPSDDDIVKVIKATIEGNPAGNTLKSAITIVERGKQLPSGDWPIKVEYTLSLKDGSEKKMAVTYSLSPSVDAMGANIWLATETK